MLKPIVPNIMKYNEATNTSLLVLSMLPHFAAILPFLFISVNEVPTAYLATIIGSTTLSVFWHSAHEPRFAHEPRLAHKPTSLLFYLDYGLGAAWSATDLFYTIRLQHPCILVLNVLVLAANKIVDVSTAGSDRQRYAAAHSLWHLMSAVKAVYVSWLIASALG